MSFTNIINNIQQHHAKKRFGQNFLIDTTIIEQIIHITSPQPQQNFIEIGPGKGALTDYLVIKTNNLAVIELDRDLAQYLRHRFAGQQLDIYQADALKFNFATLAKNDAKLRIIGNLPYNISTPLLFHLLKFRNIITDMHFMLQKEVVERICAEVGTKKYGRLSVMCQYFCDTYNVLDVPAIAFDPAPKVESAVVCLKIKSNLQQVKNLELFSTTVKQAFSQRRKTIRNALKNIITDLELENLNIANNSRAEELSVADYIKIADYLNDKNISVLNTPEGK